MLHFRIYVFVCHLKYPSILFIVIQVRLMEYQRFLIYSVAMQIIFDLQCGAAQFIHYSL